MISTLIRAISIILLICGSASALANTGENLTNSLIGWLCLGLFIVAYLFVMFEEALHLRKSKPVMFAAGLIWILIGCLYVQLGQPQAAEDMFRHTLLEFAELMLFLIVAMTYINALDERGLFTMLRIWILQKGFSHRQLFWLTGVLAFFISPLADNMTTALLMCAVVLKIADNDKAFISLCCINIVVAANSGGAFSPFGDITTLMVWQAGKVDFFTFFNLFIPAVVNFLVPAFIMSFFINNSQRKVVVEPLIYMPGSFPILLLFLLTIATAVLVHVMLHMPPVLGMMAGLSYLQLYGFYLRRQDTQRLARQAPATSPITKPFDIFQSFARIEWDTLFFFYGVVMCVGGLGFLGYLTLLSETLFGRLSPTLANTALGLISSVIDNIPVMFAVLKMAPDFSTGQWLLVTLTTGVGGSLLSIGSAAGVALMGQARGYYTFVGHLKWMPVILLGYLASIYTHLIWNAALF